MSYRISVSLAARDTSSVMSASEAHAILCGPEPMLPLIHRDHSENCACALLKLPAQMGHAKRPRITAVYYAIDGTTVLIHTGGTGLTIQPLGQSYRRSKLPLQGKANDYPSHTNMTILTDSASLHLIRKAKRSPTFREGDKCANEKVLAFEASNRWRMIGSGPKLIDLR